MTENANAGKYIPVNPHISITNHHIIDLSPQKRQRTSRNRYNTADSGNCGQKQNRQVNGIVNRFQKAFALRENLGVIWAEKMFLSLLLRYKQIGVRGDVEQKQLLPIVQKVKQQVIQDMQQDRTNGDAGVTASHVLHQIRVTTLIPLVRQYVVGKDNSILHIPPVETDRYVCM